MAIGSIQYDAIKISESSPMLKGRLQFYQELLFFDLVDQSIEHVVKSSTETTLQHHEQILKNIQAEQYYRPIDSALDLTRFFMMEYKMPITFHDYERVRQPMVVKDNQVFDSSGCIASPSFVAQRTQWDENSTSGIHFFFMPVTMDKEDQHRLLEAAGKMFSHIHGGTFHVRLL
ncbi:DNA/RNA-binding domain of Phe-tRNA-synthetase-like protein [Alkalihalobacillus xiaoxiensis]|uniref:DNA/RNA-binding domain of Phe-tRNA-synthetase-like protein n=1 Tax=Shouchella xiaoxiensis TaxID=766895 RepID=A0ABS2SQY3_9BACI|nr:hypothetical protein [Shouchella xiaoxiensis]MBM7837906.1 DNA/RNA-binding domain of Phe-tRNA-synthetase-like protein [Shouchella xiaoxiensis]